MSTISKKLSGFMFNGSALMLASAAFKSSLNSIIGINAAGTGYISYNPLNAFNSLTQLAQDAVYIVDAKTLGFDIPGATLTVTTTPAPTVSPLSLVYITPAAEPNGNGQNRIQLEYLINSTDTADSGLAGVVWNLTKDHLQDYFDAGSVNADGITSIDAYGYGASLTDAYRVDFISSNGHIISIPFKL